MKMNKEVPRFYDSSRQGFSLKGDSDDEDAMNLSLETEPRYTGPVSGSFEKGKLYFLSASLQHRD